MTTATLPELPKPKVEDGFKPVLVVDTREQTPLNFTRLQYIRGTLDTGDYSIRGVETLFAVERKSIADLVGSVTRERERFERELCRLRGYRFKRLLVIGTREIIQRGLFQSKASPKSILNTLSAFEIRYDLPIHWEPTPEAAALQVESWAWWYSREVLKVSEALTAPADNYNSPPT